MQHENLWAPWRMAYLRGLEDRAESAGPAPTTDDPNFIAAAFRAPERDTANLVVHRDEHGLVMMNRYPYSGGHLLVAHGDPRPAILDYEPAQRAAIWSLVEVATDLVQRTLGPQGINTGINQGRAAGAGLPEHLHVHLVPRWSGDTNFITTVGDIRVIPDSLERMHASYVEQLPAILADRAEAG